MRVGIISELVPFTERFSTALGNVNREDYQILTFQDLLQARTAEENHQIDILLCDERLYTSGAVEFQCPLILLVEKKQNERTEGSISYICRYKNIQEWNDILQKHKQNPSQMRKKKKEGRMVLFTSGSGGTGSTTAAAAFAMYCVKKRWKPVYLNFEPVSSIPILFHGEGIYGLDECLYSIRSNRYEFHTLIQQALQKDISGVRFLQPCKAPQDALSITGEEIVELCGKILEEPQADILILDVKPDPSMNIVLPLLASHKIVMVSNGEYIANKKTEEFFKMIPSITNMSPIEVQEKTLLLYNRFRQDSGQVLKDVSVGKLGGINLRKENEPEVLAETLSKLEPFQRLGEQLYV